MCGCRDKVAPLFHQAVELLCSALATYTLLLASQPTVLRPPVQPIVASLMHRAGETHHMQ